MVNAPKFDESRVIDLVFWQGLPLAKVAQLLGVSYYQLWQYVQDLATKNPLESQNNVALDLQPEEYQRYLEVRKWRQSYGDRRFFIALPKDHPLYKRKRKKKHG